MRKLRSITHAIDFLGGFERDPNVHAEIISVLIEGCHIYLRFYPRRGNFPKKKHAYLWVGLFLKYQDFSNTCMGKWSS